MYLFHCYTHVTSLIYIYIEKKKRMAASLWCVEFFYITITKSFDFHL